MKTEMTDEEKKAALEAASHAAKQAVEKTEGMPFWARALWVAYAALAGAVLAWLTSCGQMTPWEELTPTQRQALQAADEAYHQWSGEQHPAVTLAEGDK